MNVFNSIIEYIRFLEQEHSLYISVHCFYPPLNSFMSALGKYNTHYHPYCMQIKKDPKCWKKCLEMQNKIIKTGKKDIFFGRCCFGVYEYVVPISSHERMLGFISVSGYSKDKDFSSCNKAHLVSECENEDLACAFTKLKTVIPSESFVYSLTAHLAEMIAMMDVLIPDKKDGNNNINYIYSNALAYIHEHYTEQLSVDDIAAFCKCSRSYITKIFMQNASFGIKSYITKLRIESAKLQLRKSDKSIKEIAFSLGYNDSNYFSNVFYENVGKYPREYRNSSEKT